MPRRAQSLVVGKSRQIITDIMAKTGTVIVIPSRKEQSSAVTITGPLAAIEEAQEMIERILGYELDDNELTIAYFSIPKKQHSAIIGPEGSILKELRKKCGCHIHVPRIRDRDRNVEVHGSAAAIEAAHKELEAILGHPIAVSLTGPVVRSKSTNGSFPRKNKARRASPSGTAEGASRSSPRVLVNATTGKPRLDKGRINQVFFLPAPPDQDPMERILECISNASVSIDLYVSSLDDQNLVVLLQNLLSQNIPVRIIAKNGSDLTEIRTLQGLGAQVHIDESPSKSAIDFIIVDSAVVINGTHSWTKAGSLAVPQIITMTNHRDFVRVFIAEFNKAFSAAV